MFNLRKIENLEREIDNLKVSNKSLKQQNDVFKVERELFEGKTEKLNSSHKEALEKLANKNKDEIDRVLSNADVTLEKKTSKLSGEITQLTIDKSILKKEVEMYEKAFQNLGFDVKDMKEILNKLVDGVVAKGQIQLIK